MNEEITQENIDIREDIELSRIGDEAFERSMGRPTIPSSEVWRECNLI